MMIVSVKIVFTLATLCFAAGFAMRHRNNPLHQKLMLLGFVLTLCIAVVLWVGVYGFGETYSAAQWLIDLTGSERGARMVLIAHRAVATVTLVALIAQIVTGWRRHPLHHRLYKAAVPLWLVTYVSGLVVFV